MRTLVLLFAMMIFLSLTGCNQNGTEVPEKSSVVSDAKPAPEITVSALNGSRLRLSDLRGNIVLLNFWATWCPPCREEIPSMMKLNVLMKGKPFRIVAVSLDEGGKAAIEGFFRRNGYFLPAFTDSDGKAATTYGVTGFPTSFIIDKKGLIVKIILGPVDWSSAESIALINQLMG